MSTNPPLLSLNLRCWQCGAQKTVKASKIPSLALEIAELARDAGWIGIIDLRHRRVIVLCSEECEAKVTTKAGNIRKHPLKP